MILEKEPLPDDPTPEDAPPAYEYPGPSSSSSFPPPVPEKSAGPSSPTPSTPSSSSTPLFPPPGKKKGKARWFPFGQSKASREVQRTVHGLVRDVVRAPGAAGSAVLRDCADACAAHGLAFSAVLQEPAIEGHSALFWAVVKRPRGGDAEHAGVEMVEMMLEMASPLAEAAVAEVRLALLQAGDEVLFQRLRRTRAFSALSGADEILLGVEVPPDEIAVVEMPGSQGEFAVGCRIAQFQKRMRISKQVRLEFIARGRMWCLRFMEADVANGQYTKGTWFVSLSLMENSPPTWVDSRLTIHDTARPPPSPTKGKSSSRSLLGTSDSKDKSVIDLSLKTSGDQLAPYHPKTYNPDALLGLTAPLNKTPAGHSLQFDGCSFVASDGSLSAKLEARLAKPDSDCIIC